MTDAYSTCGRTRELYAMILISLFWMTTFLLTKPSVLLAVLVILFMWVFQLRSLLMVTPDTSLHLQILVPGYA